MFASGHALDELDQPFVEEKFGMTSLCEQAYLKTHHSHKLGLTAFKEAMREANEKAKKKKNPQVDHVTVRRAEDYYREKLPEPDTFDINPQL